MIRPWRIFRNMRWFSLWDWVGIAVLSAGLLGFLSYQFIQSRDWEETYAVDNQRNCVMVRFYLRHIELDLQETFIEKSGSFDFHGRHNKWPTDYVKYWGPGAGTGEEWKSYYHDYHYIIDGMAPRYSSFGIIYDQGIRSTTWSEAPNEGAWHATLATPLWPLIFFFAFLLFLSLYMTRRCWGQRRAALWQSKGLCPQCAYDLRAHKAGDRCPECGKEIEI